MLVVVIADDDAAAATNVVAAVALDTLTAVAERQAATDVETPGVCGAVPKSEENVCEVMCLLQAH